jgi:hypothetical protein
VAQEIPARLAAQDVPAKAAAQEIPVKTAAPYVPARPTPEAVPAKPVAQQIPAKPTAEVAPATLKAQDVPAEPATLPPPQDPGSLPTTRKNWLLRLFSTRPAIHRAALRESIPGLTAFFFTGGAPVAHIIRDVSETGVYVLTDERWYPGTIIRITLNDQREPAAKRYFTVNAIVVRSGVDGVGLHFIFQDKLDGRNGGLTTQDRAMGLADSASFKKYLDALRREHSAAAKQESVGVAP